MCGYKLDDDDQFCFNCGYNVTSLKERIASPPDILKSKNYYKEEKQSTSTKSNDQTEKTALIGIGTEPIAKIQSQINSKRTISKVLIFFVLLGLLSFIWLLQSRIGQLELIVFSMFGTILVAFYYLKLNREIKELESQKPMNQ